MRLLNERLIDDLLAGHRPLIAFTPRGGWTDAPPSPLIVLAGSFRPLHRAHRSLLSAGAKVAGVDGTTAFELSVQNVEKPTLDKESIIARLAQFDPGRDTIVLTRAATFVEKARLMPGAVFVIGYDTAVRLFDDRFYSNSSSGLATVKALKEIERLGSSFVVGGRHDETGDFKTLADIDLPDVAVPLLHPIPESLFSDPISSTAIRGSAAGPTQGHA